MTTSIWGLAKAHPAPTIDSAVDFPTRTRFHIALNVTKVVALLPFYRSLFGTAPHTLRDGYAKFDLDEPPLNFSLNEVPKNARGNGHFGIEVKSATLLDDIAERLQSLDGAGRQTRSSTLQGEVLQVRDPEGNSWRIYCTTAIEAEPALL